MITRPRTQRILTSHRYCDCECGCGCGCGCGRVPIALKLPSTVDSNCSVPFSTVIALRTSASASTEDRWQSAKTLAEITRPSSSTWRTSAITARISAGEVAQSTGIAPEVERHEELFTALEAAALWTISVELPPPPECPELRRHLKALGFRLSTERFTRTI